MEAVDRERGREDMDQLTLGKGDAGRRFTKFEVSRISREDLEGGAGAGKGSVGGPGTRVWRVARNSVIGAQGAS